MRKLSKISRILTSTWDSKPGAASNLKKRRSPLPPSLYETGGRTAARSGTDGRMARGAFLVLTVGKNGCDSCV
eukprot:8895860-Prorocentrum_lima.AAC.1